MTAPATSPNDRRRAGQPASKKVTYGDDLRYSTFAMHTRFAAVEWITTDTFNPDDITGEPGVVAQAASFQAAIISPNIEASFLPKITA